MVLITAEGGTDNTMGLLQYKIRESNVLADTVVSVNHEVEAAIVSKIQDLKRRGNEDCLVTVSGMWGMWDLARTALI